MLDCCQPLQSISLAGQLLLLLLFVPLFCCTKVGAPPHKLMPNCKHQDGFSRHIFSVQVVPKTSTTGARDIEHPPIDTSMCSFPIQLRLEM